MWEASRGAADSTESCNDPDVPAHVNIRVRHLDEGRDFLDAVAATMAAGRSCAIVRVDLDRFARLVSTHGDRRANAVRLEIEHRLRQAFGSTSAVCRTGEHSYAGLVPVASLVGDDLKTVGRALVRDLSAPVLTEGGISIAVGCNVGIAASGQFADPDPLRLLTAADIAVQRADSLGSRRVIVYAPPAEDDPSRLPHLFADMLGAIERGEFQPVYQPVYSLPESVFCGVEALVRWHHPQHGLLNPIDFIDEAESSGLVRQIDAEMRRLACSSWTALGQSMDVTISVNLSAADLDEDDLITSVNACLRDTGMPAHSLVLEVTETALASDWTAAQRVLSDLKSLGIRLAVDDFGAGHMFLDRLSTGLFDILKIDRSLVTVGVLEGSDAAERERRRTELLNAIVGIAHTFGMVALAEGVETEQERIRVVAAGCDRAQGFLFASPMPLDELSRFIDQR